MFGKEDVHITGYKNFGLKLRIQNLYHNVRFIKSSKVNYCERVVCETTNACHLINPSSTESEIESDEAEQSGASYVPSTHNLLQDLYSSAIRLKSIIKDLSIFQPVGHQMLVIYL